MIDTPRLYLRPPVLGDFSAIHGLTAGEEMRRFLSGQSTIEDDYRRLLAILGGWAVCGFGTLAFIERETGELVGTGGLFHMLRGLGDGFDGHPEAGWIVAGSRWGRGYATEAMIAAHAWFNSTHGSRRTVCMIVPGNSASERIAAKLGYQPFRDATHRGDPVRLYERLP